MSQLVSRSLGPHTLPAWGQCLPWASYSRGLYSNRYHVDIPASAQRPCCSAPNLVCDQQHILTVQGACRHFNLTQDTGTWSRKCRVYDVCHEDVSKPLTSDQSVVMTIRLVNAYYMYNVELLGLIERSMMCSSLQYDLGDCFVCRCITGSLMLLSSTTNPQEQGGNSSSDTAEDMCIPAATTDLVYNCPSFSKIKDVPQRSQCVRPGKAITLDPPLARWSHQQAIQLLLYQGNRSSP